MTWRLACLGESQTHCSHVERKLSAPGSHWWGGGEGPSWVGAEACLVLPWVTFWDGVQSLPDISPGVLEEQVGRSDSGNGRHADSEAFCSHLKSPDFLDVATWGNGTGKRSLTPFRDQTAYGYMVLWNICQHQSFSLDLMLPREPPVQKNPVD